MALVPCPECAREVSSRASCCPSCGCPITRDSCEKPIAIVARPQIAADLAIGGQIINWTYDAAVKGHFDVNENACTEVHEGTCRILLHKAGLSLGTLIAPRFNIHSSQLLNIQYVSRSVLYDENKSVIKRAAVGALILGPLGALVGGMSGIGTKSRVKSTGYIVVNYWDVKSDQPASILVSVNDESEAKRFCTRTSTSLLGVAAGRSRA